MYGGDSEGNKTGKSGAKSSRGTRAGKNMGRRRGTPAGTPGSSVRDMRSSTSGGPKKKDSSVMREATWNSMPKGQRMREHGTTSYAKYKADKVKMRANAASARSQRGGGGSRRN